MAKTFTFSARTASIASPTFIAKSNFIVTVHSTIASEYSLQMLPDNLEDNDTNWITIGAMTLTNTRRSVTGSAASGYKYRLLRNNTAETSDPVFYYGNLTTVQYNFG